MSCSQEFASFSCFILFFILIFRFVVCLVLVLNFWNFWRRHLTILKSGTLCSAKLCFGYFLLRSGSVVLSNESCAHCFHFLSFSLSLSLSNRLSLLEPGNIFFSKCLLACFYTRLEARSSNSVLFFDLFSTQTHTFRWISASGTTSAGSLTILNFKWKKEKLPDFCNRQCFWRLLEKLVVNTDMHNIGGNRVVTEENINIFELNNSKTSKSSVIYCSFHGNNSHWSKICTFECALHPKKQ